MSFYVKTSDRAEFDIFSAVDYITNELYSPQAAKRFHENINRKIGLIHENPFMFPLSRNESLAAKGYRCFTVGNYLILYLVDEGEKLITIARIILGSRDLTGIDT